jgi:alanyl-tRNA synthetase
MREMFTGQRILEITDPVFFSTMIDCTLELSTRNTPRLSFAKNIILRYIANETERFEHTIRAGYVHLEQMLNDKKNGSINGEDVIELEKMLGVPFPILDNWLKTRGITYRLEDYQNAKAIWHAMAVSTQLSKKRDTSPEGNSYARESN